MHIGIQEINTSVGKVHYSFFRNNDSLDNRPQDVSEGSMGDPRAAAKENLTD